MTATRERRWWLVGIGTAILVAALVASVVLWIAAGQRRDNAIQALARAPVGCDTVLNFERPGKFLLFIETSGTVTNVRGDCAPLGTFAWTGSGDRPVASLSLVDASGNDVTLQRDSGVSYSGAGSRGSLVRSVNVDQPGPHTLRVESDDTNFAIAVGADPNSGVSAMRSGSVLLLLGGLVAGMVMIVIGLRGRVRTTTTQPAAAAGPTPGWPISPPGFPAPPPTTGATGAIGPPIRPPVRAPSAPLPAAPVPPQRSPSGPSWGPPQAPGQ
jgi:hypothetical protein